MVRIAGIDLAWGDRKPDGVCVLEARQQTARVRAFGLVRGDAGLLAWLDEYVGPGAALVMMDGPIICPNPTGSRPVDRLMHTLFGPVHAGCHPANLTKCPRPSRIADLLRSRGFDLGWEWRPGAR